MNTALAEAFKQFKPSRSKKDAKKEETLTHFRNRVIDLLDIYVQSGPSMMCCLEIVVPLLQTLEFAIQEDSQRQLEARVTHCLKELTAIKKFGQIEAGCEKLLIELVSNLLDKDTRAASVTKHMASIISSCCGFIIRCAQVSIMLCLYPKTIGI